VEEGSAGSTRRDFLKTSGYLVVGVGALSMAGPLSAAVQESAAGATGLGPGPYPDPDFLQLDSWIVIREDNTATFYVGKTDLGQGTGTAFRQVMSDELDIAFENTSCVMGRTEVTVDQGGSGGSDALQTDGWPMRRVAAEARRVLLEMASVKLAVPVSELTVKDGVVSVKSDPTKSITYGELIGSRRFNVTLSGEKRELGHREGGSQAGTGNEARRPVASTGRHSRQGGRLARVGRRREAPRHAPRPKREAARSGCQARERGRVLRQRNPRIRPRRHEGKLRRRRLRARRAGHPGRRASSR